MTPEEHTIQLDLSPEAALAAVAREAEEWGGTFERDCLGGRLRLPVEAGLRRGVVSGPLTAAPAEGGTRVTFRCEESVYVVQAAAVSALIVAGAGALLTMAWPLYPTLLVVAPLGAVLALGGWFLVLSRLRNSGPEEFLGRLRHPARRMSSGAGGAGSRRTG